MNTKKLVRFMVICAVSALIYQPLTAQNQTGQKNKIKLTKFTITEDHNKKISIDWTTDNAVLTNYFEVQKSFDGLNFKTIALVLGADPRIIAGDTYGCFDKNVESTKHLYYRLKHKDNDGTEEISETKQLAKL